MLIARYDNQLDEIQISDDHGCRCGYVETFGLMAVLPEEWDNLLRVNRDSPPGHRVSTTNDDHIYTAFDVVCFNGEVDLCSS